MHSKSRTERSPSHSVDEVRLEAGDEETISLEGEGEDAGTEGQEPTSVLIADDHPFVREGVKRVLKQEGFVVCAEAEDSATAVRAALALGPDVCVLGVRMQGGGIQAISKIKQALPETVVLMISASDEEGELLDSLRVGAAGFLAKDTPPEALPSMIRAALRGESAIPRRLVSVVLDAFINGDRRILALPSGENVRLTPREWEVLELLDQGLSTHDIAGRLFVSPVTVRRHIGTVIKKLEVRDRPAALGLFRDHAQDAAR